MKCHVGFLLIAMAAGSLTSEVIVDMSKAIHVTNENFLSFTLDSSIFGDVNRWVFFNIT